MTSAAQLLKQLQDDWFALRWEVKQLYAALDDAAADAVLGKVREKLLAPSDLPRQVTINSLIPEIVATLYPSVVASRRQSSIATTFRRIRDDALEILRAIPSNDPDVVDLKQDVERWMQQAQTLPPNALLMSGVLSFFESQMLSASTQALDTSSKRVQHEKLSKYLEARFKDRLEKQLAKSWPDILQPAYKAMRSALCAIYREGSELAVRIVEATMKNLTHGRGVCE